MPGAARFFAAVRFPGIALKTGFREVCFQRNPGKTLKGFRRVYFAYGPVEVWFASSCNGQRRRKRQMIAAGNHEGFRAGRLEAGAEKNMVEFQARPAQLRGESRDAAS